MSKPTRSAMVRRRIDIGPCQTTYNLDTNIQRKLSANGSMTTLQNNRVSFLSSYSLDLADKTVDHGVKGWLLNNILNEIDNYTSNYNNIIQDIFYDRFQR
jgi:hypothetical protein